MLIIYRLLEMIKNHLTIDINKSSVRFSLLNGNILVKERSFIFSDRQDYRYKQQLDDFWKETNWKESDFDEVSLSWSEYQTTLIPSNVFNESDKDSIFQLTFGSNIHQEEIDYNRLPMQGIVNIFSIPLWVKSFFVIRFPRIVIQHEGTHLIRGLFSEATFKLKSKISLHQDHFIVAVVKENNLQFYSTFEWTTIEDIVYYYSFLMQQLSFQDQENELEIAVNNNLELNEESLTKAFEAVFSKIKLSFNQFLIEKYQQLCV